MADDWRTPDTTALFDAIGSLEGLDETERFFRDLCTLTELHDLSQRWAVARLLDSGLHYAEISKRTGASTATITRIASWLHHGEGGYRAVLDKSTDRPAIRHHREAADEPDPGHLRVPTRPASRSAGRRRTRRSPRATASRSSQIVRFDQNTSPAPPELRRASCSPSASSTSRSPSTRRRTTAAHRGRGRAVRRRARGAARRRGRGRDPRPRREGLPAAGRRGRRADADVRDVSRCSPSSAARRVVRGPAPRRGGGLGAGPRGMRAAARKADLVWLCSPNNPTGAGRAHGAIAGLLGGLARGRGRRRPRPAPSSCSTRRMSSSGPSRSSASGRAIPRLVVDPDDEQGLRLAGLRVGFAIARRDAHRSDEPVSAAGLGLGRVGRRRHRSPAGRHDAVEANLRRVATERDRFAGGLRGAAGRSASRSRTSCWWTSDRPRSRRRWPRACSARHHASHLPRRPPARGSPPPHGPDTRAGRSVHRGRHGHRRLSCAGRPAASRTNRAGAGRSRAGACRSARPATPRRSASGRRRIGHPLAVDRHAAARDHPPRFAPRREHAGFGQEHGGPVRHGRGPEGEPARRFEQRVEGLRVGHSGRREHRLGIARSPARRPPLRGCVP